MQLHHSTPSNQFNQWKCILEISGPVIFTLPEDTGNPELDGGVPSVQIIDAMCIVNIVIKNPDKSIALYFSEKWVEIVLKMGISLEMGHFGPIDLWLLQKATQGKGNFKTTTILYHVNDNSAIRNIKNSATYEY